MAMSNTVMYLLQVNLLQLDSKMSRKQTIPLRLWLEEAVVPEQQWKHQVD
jgi:hypothetical protein